ncbi:unnamed protein product [Amoebophrya sp. A25]|nr:unnamed protein product [Amoebophrya sp. A25]|eukprot:GSA25T00024212001.1
MIFAEGVFRALGGRVLEKSPRNEAQSQIEVEHSWTTMKEMDHWTRTAPFPPLVLTRPQHIIEPLLHQPQASHPQGAEAASMTPDQLQQGPPAAPALQFGVGTNSSGSCDAAFPPRPSLEKQLNPYGTSFHPSMPLAPALHPPHPWTPKEPSVAPFTSPPSWSRDILRAFAGKTFRVQGVKQNREVTKSSNFPTGAHSIDVAEDDGTVVIGEVIESQTGFVGCEVRRFDIKCSERRPSLYLTILGPKIDPHSPVTRLRNDDNLISDPTIAIPTSSTLCLSSSSKMNTPSSTTSSSKSSTNFSSAGPFAPGWTCPSSSSSSTGKIEMFEPSTSYSSNVVPGTSASNVPDTSSRTLTLCCGHFESEDFTPGEKVTWRNIDENPLRHRGIVVWELYE